jgi:putative ABC transport system permease protein
MTEQIIEISNFRLGLTMLFILFCGALSLRLKLGLEKDLIVGSIRTFAQLFIMGWVLAYVFSLDMAFPVLLIFLMMVFFSSRIVFGRVGKEHVPYKMPVLISMLLGYSITSWLVTDIIVNAQPWWTPQYFIPLAGMIVGSSMNALSISLERLFGELRRSRDEVEMKLALGAAPMEAGRELMRRALKAGMIPSINAMMGVGLVSLPGMMTGQILAGTDPLVAIRYQIIVMLMLVGATAVSSAIVVLLVGRRCFDDGQRLVLDAAEQPKLRT